MKELREALRRYLAPRRHSALLVAMVAVFTVRPLIGDCGVASAVFSIALVFLLLVALYNIHVDELVGERGRSAHSTEATAHLRLDARCDSRRGTSVRHLCPKPNAQPGGFDLLAACSSCL